MTKTRQAVQIKTLDSVKIYVKISNSMRIIMMEKVVAA